MRADLDQPSHDRRRRWFDLGVRAISAVLPDLGTSSSAHAVSPYSGATPSSTGESRSNTYLRNLLAGSPSCSHATNATLRPAIDLTSTLNVPRRKSTSFAEHRRDRYVEPSTTAGTPLVGEVLATPGGMQFLGVPKANHPARPGEVVDALDALAGEDAKSPYDRLHIARAVEPARCHRPLGCGPPTWLVSRSWATTTFCDQVRATPGRVCRSSKPAESDPGSDRASTDARATRGICHHRPRMAT